MSRFFVDINCIDSNIARLCAEDSAHAVRVLRLGNGDPVTICDGCGNDYDGIIISADKSEVLVELSNKHTCDNESTIKITLIQCLPKSGKMELIIQKCVELGIFSIQPVTSVRSVIKADKKSNDTKLVRYNKIAYEAAKQSQRGIIPQVLPICGLTDIDFSSFDALIVPYEEERDLSVKRLTNNMSSIPQSIAVVIGPEGGIDAAEIDYLKQFGGVCVTLGRRILRTETAGMATLAILYSMLEG